MTKPKDRGRHVVLYLIGSLRNPEVPKIANLLRKKADVEVFDDWFAAGPKADDSWRDYEVQRGNTYAAALEGHAAKHVFTFDDFYLNRCHGAVLVYPAGRSGHLELGKFVGSGKPGFILLDNIPRRYDVMKQLATGGLHVSTDALVNAIQTYPWPKVAPFVKMHQHEVLWLAGLLEGEGSFCIHKAIPRLMLQMTDYDVVAHAARLFQSKVWGGTHRTKGGKLVWACGANGLTGIEWMRILKPYMGHRRQTQITSTVRTWLERRGYHKEDAPFWMKAFQL